MGKSTTKFVVIVFLLILSGIGRLGWQVYSTYQIVRSCS
jgi:predicted negative regulator of RcsB-dependent stress response